MKQRILLYYLIALLPFPLCKVQATHQPEFSTAGFYQLANSGRDVFSMNPAWRLHKGAAPGAEAIHFDDRNWEVVSLPNGIEYLPTEASGCINYQGEAWYRKHFTPADALKGKKLFLHFEAIMGKSKVFVNGKLLAEHFGGYLPVVVDITNALKWETDNIIAVWTDNSNDPGYPPGKAQDVLDYTYFGGIYRDCWLIAHNSVFITDPNFENETAGGGLFVAYDKVSDNSAEVLLKTHVRNESKKTFTGVVEYELQQPDGRQVAFLNDKVQVRPGKAITSKDKIIVKKPMLWSPENPTLYNLIVRIRDNEGNTIDGYRRRIGIRSIEFKGKDGFLLNGKPYESPLIGANRHQDFAVVGNAVANSIHWRDAKKLRDAGLKIIRNAHCPQDPAFMDACDELGLFVIVATPGWQYWNKDPKFGELVHQNTREMIRRDRNHPSVLMWEPILNETRYPLDFALKALEITKEEYPYPGRPIAAADVHSAGVKEHYDVVYGWPGDDEKEDKPEQCIFTREFGENVDDWYAHNNNNRASRSWGERPLLIQALSLAKSYDEMYRTTGQFIGGTQWHPFDHQRGYHPDPYWGGIYDAFRQKKYAYEMFRSQSPASLQHPLAECGPMIFLAHEMSQFSDKDVVVFSNCDSIRLSIYDGTKTWTKPVVHAKGHMPNAPVIFENVWDFWEARGYSYTQKNWQKVNMVAEGIIDGKVVCTQKKMPSRRSTKLRLYADTQKVNLVADGSDFIVVVAEVTDDSGNVRRLAKENIVFTVEGEGEIIGDARIGANPRAVEFGSAPLLIRSTRKAGKIKVKAHVQFEGTQAPTAAEMEFESVPAELPFCYDEKYCISQDTPSLTVKATLSENATDGKVQLTEEERQRVLDEVERQQTEFGIEK